ncbi:hypothetical protein FKM82_007842 [Ascaphus truei]
MAQLLLYKLCNLHLFVISFCCESLIVQAFLTFGSRSLVPLSNHIAMGSATLQEFGYYHAPRRWRSPNSCCAYKAAEATCLCHHCSCSKFGVLRGKNSPPI